MKFLERFILIIYSYVILLLAIVISLLIFKWISFDVVSNMLKIAVTGETVSKITLAICALFMIFSIKCLFFDSHTKEVIKESQGILLKNTNGQLLITKETLDNMVKTIVNEFSSINECIPKIFVNEQNEISVTLQIIVNENVIIKDLANDLQIRVKEEMKRTSDLDVQTVNVKILNINKSEKKTKAE